MRCMIVVKADKNSEAGDDFGEAFTPEFREREESRRTQLGNRKAS